MVNQSDSMGVLSTLEATCLMDRILSPALRWREHRRDRGHQDTKGDELSASTVFT